MSSYTDDEITETLEAAAVALTDLNMQHAPRLIRALATEYPRLKADAERYRYLRCQPMKDGWAMANIELMDENEDGPTGVWYNYENEELDAAIDDARGKEGK